MYKLKKEMSYHLSDRIVIFAAIESIGRDLIVKISGGDSHIGAVAIGFPDGKVVLHECKNHREGDLCSHVAKEIAVKIGSKVCVIAGIHFDAITKNEINTILENCDTIIDDFLLYIKSAY